jgi:hypothetical protein
MDEKDSIKNLIEKFLNDNKDNENLFMKGIDGDSLKEIKNAKIYNEFSLQHELGLFLRKELEKDGYKVQFERNVEFFGGDKKKFVKKEMDIVVFNNRNLEKYAIELKFPINGFYEKRMHHFVKDIQFMEEVVQPKEMGGLGFTQTYCLTLISDLANGKMFRTGEKVDSEIAKYFVDPKVSEIKKEDVDEKVPPYIEKKKEHPHKISGSYPIEWEQIDSTEYYYYLIEIPNDSKKIIIGKR